MSEQIARLPANARTVKAEKAKLLAGRFTTFDGISAQDDYLAVHAAAGAVRTFGVVQRDTSDPKGSPEPNPHDNELRTKVVGSGSIARVQAGAEVESGQDCAIGAGGKAIPATGAVAATLVTGKVSDNNAILYTANNAGTGGNKISVELLNTGKEKALSVNVDGNKIIVTLATNGTGAGEITSTAALVIAAINAHDTASQLVTAANSSTSSGAGVVAAVATTKLEGGATSTDNPAVGKILTDGETDDFVEVEIF